MHVCFNFMLTIVYDRRKGKPMTLRLVTASDTPSEPGIGQKS